MHVRPISLGREMHRPSGWSVPNFYLSADEMLDLAETLERQIARDGHEGKRPLANRLRTARAAIMREAAGG